MTKSTGERLYRACVRCRQRKTKCDLQYTSEYTHRPCSKCSAQGNRCVPATSRRGGDYSRFRVRRNQAQRHSDNNQRAGSPVDRRVSRDRHPDNEVAKEPSDSALGGVQNPLEALQILAQTASRERTMRRKSANQTNDWSDQPPLIDEHSNLHDDNTHELPETNPSIMTSDLIQEGIVDVQLLEPLLQYYIQNYHSYLPIVPSSLLVLENLDRSWATETFLLAAVLTISTKDRVGLESLHRRILGHMERLILRVVLGATSVRHVGSVEGLLLLAEWVPHVSAGTCTTYDTLNYRSSKQLETPDEDSVAWNLIGLAVRQAYLLHLERCSFREAKDESSTVFSRKKLAWFFTYLADRQISIQMGQAFWCRGPGLSSRFIVEDYPSLHPQTPGGINHASFIQAQVELTTMFGNIHDILYASKTRSIQLMLMGDYTKYLDDSSKALSMWKDTFGHDLPPHLSCLLSLQFEYLRLYVNAFAFQAVIYRSSKSATGSDQGKTQYFPHSVMASPDGRHIYLAIDAAKNVLKKLMEKLNPTKHFRYLPVRFYLYEIHASVFLFKALSVGALTSGEQQSCSVLIRQFISMLQSAATSSSHIASRYGKLLTNLWFQGQITPDNSHEFTQSRDQAQTFSVNPPNTVSNYIEVTHRDAMEHIEAPPTLPDIFQSSIQAPYGDSTEILGCPDAFLSNLPFLRGGFPDLDDNGVGQLLMDL